MDIQLYFQAPKHQRHRKYEVVRAFVIEEKSAEAIANKFGYTVATVYSIIRDFKKRLANNTLDPYLFTSPKLGRNEKQMAVKLQDKIILLRKQYLSVEEIKEKLDAQNEQVSESYIYQIVRKAGFAKLPRRTKMAKKEIQANIIFEAPKSEKYDGNQETINTSNIGILCFLPLMQHYGLIQLIENSTYPETKTLSKINSILSFIALKLSNIKRYTKDDLWCMDRGLGLFAGLNVLPKAAWFSSYSDRVTRKMNLDFLRALHRLWVEQELLSDTANLDFTAVPYWGNDSHVENNWSGKRHQALASILAALAQDPDSGIVTYGDADVQQEKEADVVIEFLDFYYSNKGSDLKYLVFDSKFTTYQNLCKLDAKGVKFITIRRRGQNIVSELEALPKTAWTTVRVLAGDGKKRRLKVYEQKLFLRDYEKEIRQIAITGHGKIKPALIITNDFEMTKGDIIRKYAKRWIVEKTISEQTEFFHLNRISSSMVIKVDFDLTMTILAYNLYRLLAIQLPRYEHQTAERLFEKFISNSGKVQIAADTITVSMKKKRNLPAILTAMEKITPIYIDFLDKKINFESATYS